MGRVLVLDGNQRSSLAVVRSLSRKGIDVTVGDYVYPTISSASRFCQTSIQYHNPYTDPESCVRDIEEEIKKNHYDVMIPMTDVTVSIILRNRRRFKRLTTIPFVSYDTYDLASDKWRILRCAGELGIPIPNTIFLNSKRDLGKVRTKLTYPVVIKPARSQLLTNRQVIPTKVAYAENYEQLKGMVDQSEVFDFCPFMIQEKINGDGIGLFALYQNGVPKLLFSHRRLREKPPSGGVSVLCKSMPIDSTIKEFGLKLLDHLKWHGVAMVEFKRSGSDGVPYLMEINARFWGSLQLSIDAGVDFPYGLYCTALQKDLEGNQGQYKLGVKNKWILGNLDCFYMLFKEGRYSNAGRSFFDALSPSIHHSVLQLTDPKPFLAELRQYLRDLVSS